MPLRDLLGIDYPIIQSGMGGVAGSALAAAVSNAGGLGILAGHGIGPEELIVELSETRRLTDKSFGVNLLLAPDLLEIAAAPVTSVQVVNDVLNPLRAEVGLRQTTGLPSEPANDVLEKLEIILEARPSVLSIGMGIPDESLVERCRTAAITVIAMATTLEDAQVLETAGVDAVVIQGAEAGGHRSHFHKPDDRGYGLVGSMVLIPEAVDGLKIPVIAAGGITDGRGLIAALALGASAVMMGTRFIATKESLATAAYKRAILESRCADSVVTDAASGRYARMLRNRFTDAYGDAPTLPFGWQGSAVSELFERARESEDAEHFAVWAGQSAGRVSEELSAAEVVRQIIEEALNVTERLNACRITLAV